MRNLVYAMGVSLDGFIAGPNGEIDWSAPDAELHQFHNQQTRETGLHLYGRGLYEAMAPWEDAEQRPSATAEVLEFARLWKQMPKLVFSTTLDEVRGTNLRLARGSLADEVVALKQQPGQDLAVGGAGLAASLTELGLIDEYRMFVNPVVLGGGTPYFASPPERIDLELVETRTFSQVVYLRYRRASEGQSR